MTPGTIIEVHLRNEIKPRRALVCNSNGEDRCSVRLERHNALRRKGYGRFAPLPLNVRLLGSRWLPV